MGRYAVVFFKKVDLAAHPPLFVSVGIFFSFGYGCLGRKGIVDRYLGFLFATHLL